MSLHINCSCHICCPDKYTVNLALNKTVRRDSEEPMQETKHEVKLEVGKKYNMFNPALNKYYPIPHWLVYQNENNVVFEDDLKKLFTVPKDRLQDFRITEHRELIKNSFEGWIHESFFEKFLDNKFAGIYKEKEDCEQCEMLYGTFTFEQKPEPENK